ncbi:MAG: ABC transporter ATP-binding protein [Lachnospiraceae bacterium]|nr:ABC transporter ATP-binding protein [Lachnospiraceae bacterium]
MKDKREGFISLRNVSSGYNKKTVLKDISLTIPAGKTVLIIGENGSGKSTLLKTMAGLLPYTGSVQVDEKEMNTLSEKERAAKIAMLSQMNRAYFSYTVEETVRMGRYRFTEGLFASFNKKDHEAVKAAMEKTGIYDIRKEQLSSLSGGQLQRVYLARMFAQEADYIFLDEPTNHLDLKYRVILEQYLKKENASVVAIYHDLLQAFAIADEIILLKDGRVLKQDTPENIINSGLLNEAFDMDVISYLKSVKKESEAF